MVAFELVELPSTNPEGPSTQYLRTLVPNTIASMLLGPESLNIGYLDPLGSEMRIRAPSATMHLQGMAKGCRDLSQTAAVGFDTFHGLPHEFGKNECDCFTYVAPEVG